MIKCIIDKEIDGIDFKIIYITQNHDLNSVFSIETRDYFFIIVNLDNYSVLKENRDYNLLPDFRIDRLMNEYYNKIRQLSIAASAELFVQEVSI